MADIYAKAGEHIVCEAGHHVCTVLRDVHQGQRFDPDALGEWAIPVPQVGRPIPLCHCGELFCRNFHSFHFKDGWR
jgi:hypothetical protein